MENIFYVSDDRSAVGVCVSVDEIPAGHVQVGRDVYDQIWAKIYEKSRGG